MTEQITNIPDKGNKKRIVIVGGGFGGLKIARKLKRQHYKSVEKVHKIRFYTGEQKV